MAAMLPPVARTVIHPAGCNLEEAIGAAPSGVRLRRETADPVAHPLQPGRDMPITTSPAPSSTFEPIALDDLLSVQGGCGKKKACCPCPAPAPAPAVAAAAVAVAPMAAPPPPAPSVETSVSVSYQ